MINCRINPHIERYLQIVENREARVCREQIALAAHIRKCFAEEDIYTDDEQLENYLSLVKYFNYSRLFEWQEFIFALHLCTYWRDTGLPRWPELFCLMGRGGGKDGTIAFESVCLTSPYNGIRGYDVDICANNEIQATRPVKDVREAFEQPEHINKLKKFYYWNKEEVVSLTTQSTIKGWTNSPKGKDGLRSGIVIFNEFHQYENTANINVFTTGLGKRKHPRRSIYTTNGDVRGGPLDEYLDLVEPVLFGGEPDDGKLLFICKLDNKDEVHDEANWEKAVPALRYLPDLVTEIRKEYKEWVRNPSLLPAFMTKRFNVPGGDTTKQVTDYENIKATNRELPDLTGWSCSCGIDFAKSTDWASCNFHFRDGDTRFDINHSWICLKSKELSRIKAPWREWVQAGLVTPVDDVEISPYLITEYIRKNAENYNILKVAIDNFRYSLLKYALTDIGFEPKDEKNLILVRPSDIMKVQPVIDSCFNNQYFVWGDNPALRWATNNTKLVQSGSKTGIDTGNFYYAKIEPKSRKTDPFMALVASMVIEDVLGDGSSSELPPLGVITI